ncbi:hypothetical protein ACROYT_G041473 [Oculina patagonica]
MDSKRLVVFLCVWLAFTCILIDQAESFTTRSTRSRRRRRHGKKRDFIPSAYRGQRAVASLVWGANEYPDSSVRRTKLRR